MVARITLRVCVSSHLGLLLHLSSHKAICFPECQPLWKTWWFVSSSRGRQRAAERTEYIEMALPWENELLIVLDDWRVLGLEITQEQSLDNSQQLRSRKCKEFWGEKWENTVAGLQNPTQNHTSILMRHV